MRTIAAPMPQLLDTDWVPFAGGELEGRRPKTMCPSCRERLWRQTQQATHTPRATGESQASPQADRALCFECHRVDLARERALKAAGELNTTSDARFQSVLPLEPVNQARLARLKVERRQARVRQAQVSPYVDRRRQAQLTAQQALRRLADGLRARGVLQAGHAAAAMSRPADRANGPSRPQLPEAWLPFAVSQ